jgi:HSP20 family protein
MTYTKLHQTHREPASNRVPPRVAHFDCWKNAKEVVLQGDFPGIERRDLVIEFHEGTLNISSSAKATSVAGTSRFREFERIASERSFKFHEEIDADRIKASFKDAVLTLVLPFVQPAEPKRIPVTDE